MQNFRGGALGSDTRSIDLVSFCVFLALLMIGWLMIFSVNYEEVSGTGAISFFWYGAR